MAHDPRSVLELRVGRSRPADSLFGDSIRWMVARDMTAQWGSTPFSQVPKRVESIQKWSSSGRLRICERDGRPAAAMVLGDAQPTKTETFTVGEWPGQVLERRIGVPAAQ